MISKCSFNILNINNYYEKFPEFKKEGGVVFFGKTTPEDLCGCEGVQIN